MSRSWILLPLALSLGAPAAAAPAAAPAEANPPAILSAARAVDLRQHLVPERPTVLVFTKPSSTLERQWLENLRKETGPRVGFVLVHLASGSEPLARKYEISETPTALVYDRRKRLVTRSSDPGEITAAVKKAAGVMRIDWLEEDDPRAELLRQMGVRGGVNSLPGIMRTMSFKPSWMAAIGRLAQEAHFSPGYLDRRTKEMIATYVSALNRCKY